MSNKDTNLTIRIDSNRKEQWKDLAEEKGFSGLTGLIKFAVTQVKKENNVPETSQLAPEVTSVDPEMKQQLKSIENTVEAIETEVTATREKVDAKANTPAASAIISQLPSNESDALPEYVIAQDMGISDAAVRDALSWAQDSNSRLKQTTVNGERRWFLDD